MSHFQMRAQNFDQYKTNYQMAETSRIPTNIRTLLVLEALSQESEPLTPAEIGRRVGLPKQTAHRLCNVLIEEGILVRDEQGHGLRPGRRARTMASGLLYASTAHFARRQVLLDLADEIGETINFAIPDDRGMSYRDRVETDWMFRIQLPVGSEVPFHCTASGKTYLSTLPRAERRRIVHVMSLPRLTPNTITDPDDLLEELNRIGRQGYATDNEEFHEGMVAIAVPVRDPNGRYFASLAFHAPTQRVTLERAIELTPVVTRAAERLTQTIF